MHCAVDADEGHDGTQRNATTGRGEINFSGQICNTADY